MWLAQDESSQGIGCPGGACLGADGHLYEWVEGVDGLGNPIGFWKRLKKLARRVAPLARQLQPFIPPGAAAAVTPFLRRAAPFIEGAEGLGYAGEIAEGPDGNLYQWVQGVDGLGNPFGFWKRLKRGLKKAVKRSLPLAQRFAPFIPGGAAALTVAAPILRQAGLSGYDGIGALYEAGDGSLYRVEGLSADDDISGLEEDDELRGLTADELEGLADDDELRSLNADELEGLADNDELRGPEDDELRGIAEDELQGFGDDEIQGFADEEMQGVDGYVRPGVDGLGAFVPDAARETPMFKAPAQPPPMWAPIW